MMIPRTDKKAHRDHIHRLVEEHIEDITGKYRYRCVDCNQRLKLKSGVMVRKPGVPDAR